MIGGWTVRVTSHESGADITRFYHAAVPRRTDAEQAVRTRLGVDGEARVVAVATVPEPMIQTHGLQTGDVKPWG